uniref:Uncharacterized protein n=1 Tax=Knipowitschia caucasica TaxID=637954 RepID=A0AAV2L6T7_KNICA
MAEIVEKNLRISTLKQETEKLLDTTATQTPMIIEDVAAGERERVDCGLQVNMEEDKDMLEQEQNKLQEASNQGSFWSEIKNLARNVAKRVAVTSLSLVAVGYCCFSFCATSGYQTFTDLPPF